MLFHLKITELLFKTVYCVDGKNVPDVPDFPPIFTPSPLIGVYGVSLML